MQASPEVKNVIKRSYEALENGDLSFLERTISQQEGVLVVGTDPKEWWSDYATIIKVFKAQLEEMGQLTVSESSIKAYSDGNVGWADDRPSFRLADGTTIPLRLTAVLCKENAEWKIVQWHISTGAPNEEIVGRGLTTE